MPCVRCPKAGPGVRCARPRWAWKHHRGLPLGIARHAQKPLLLERPRVPVPKNSVADEFYLWPLWLMLWPKVMPFACISQNFNERRARCAHSDWLSCAR
jgi:hypothetical protein